MVLRSTFLFSYCLKPLEEMKKGRSRLVVLIPRTLKLRGRRESTSVTATGLVSAIPPRHSRENVCLPIPGANLTDPAIEREMKAVALP